MNRQKIAVLLGTRPEVVKLAPVIKQLTATGRYEVTTISTGQHREMLQQALAALDLPVDEDLALMQQNQSPETVTARVLEAVGGRLRALAPDLVLVQGDTTTTFAGALAAFYNRIPVGHVEAGLRTGQMSSPWPEEANRRLTGVLADLHFTPTEKARQNLLREGVPAAAVHLTGNTVTDAVLMVGERLAADPVLRDTLAKRFSFLEPGRRTILVTGHRRESFGKPLEDVCQALLRIARAYPDVQLVYPVHLNPNVEGPVCALLAAPDAAPPGSIHLIPPVDYLSLIYLLSRCHFVITDSGGIQEEAPVFGKPVLVTRNHTEREEAVSAGTAKLVGTDQEVLFTAANALLSDETVYAAMSAKHSPFGDGRAAERIVSIIQSWFES